MQKVVGSSPIIRSPEPAGNGGVFRGRKPRRRSAPLVSQRLVSVGGRERPARRLEVFGLALVLAHSPSLVEAFGGPTPISLAEFRAGG